MFGSALGTWSPFASIVVTSYVVGRFVSARAVDGQARSLPGGATPVHRVCPWWLGPILASPVRRLIESTVRLLGPLVRPGMIVVEPGCGMGFFTLPLARLVGPNGKVVCRDFQPQMIAGRQRRARRAGLLGRIDASVCTEGDAGLGALAGSADLAVAIHMLHEVPDASPLLTQLHAALRPGGVLLVVEHKGHVSRDGFAQTLALTEAIGFVNTGRTLGGRGLTELLEKR
jgi:SAM-dependent methyltransferase